MKSSAGAEVGTTLAFSEAMIDANHSGESTLSCAGVSALAFEYLDGEMPVGGQAALDAHVGQCSPCREYLERERSFLRSIKAGLAGERCPEKVRERIREVMRQRRESRSAT